MLCLFKTLALGLFSDPGPVENALQTRVRAHTHTHTVCCHFGRFDVLVTQVAAIPSIHRALCWMQPWDL